MTFINSGALWGLCLIIIPIIIHLFNFRKVKKLYFSNVSFLTSVKSQSNSKNLIRKLLILTLRILSIVFLVIAFARPFSVSNYSNADIRNVSFYLDNSLSMGRNAIGGNDLLSGGLNLLSSMLESYPENLSIGFITNDFNKNNRPVFIKDIEDRLTEVSLSNRTQEIAKVSARMERVNLNTDQLYIFSDFQKNAFNGLPQLLDDTLKYFHLFQLEAESQSNLFIDSLSLENAIGFPNKNKLQLSIKNCGKENFEDVLIKIYKDDKQITSFTKKFTGNTKTWVDVDLSGSDNLEGRYQIEIEDGTFIFDNKYYFVIDEFRKPKIYQVYSDKPNTYIKNVYSNPLYFELKLSSINNIGTEDLMGSDLIVLDGLSEIPSWFNNLLDDYKNALLVIPKKSVDIISYSSLLNAGIQLNKDTTIYSINPESLKHPYFTDVFNEKSSETNLPWMRRLISVNGLSDVILKSNTDIPLLFAIKQDFFVLACPLDDVNTNFHKHGLFLPLMYKLSMYNRINTDLSYSLDEQVISIGNDSLLLSGNLRLESKTDQVILNTRNINGDLFLEIPPVLEKPGFYSLVNGTDTLRTIAFNLSEKESEIAVLTNDEIRQIIDGRKNVSFEQISDVQIYSEKFADKNEGLPLWKYALLLALVFLITELTLLRVFR